MRPLDRRAFHPLIALPLAGLVLAGCGADLTADDGPLGGGSLDQSVSGSEAQAPDPAGEQLSHEQMREALQEHASGTLTDTDDWWPHLRDLNRELQMLRVQPTDCKPYVTASALPVPAGALGALAEDTGSQSVIYTFEDAESAQDYLQTEREGMDLCGKHTVTRDLGDTKVEATTELTEIDVSSGADDAYAVRQTMESGDTSQHHLAVLLRQGAHLVLVAEPEPEETDEEEAVVDLEVTAARILSDLVGEEILAPEPEPEEDDDADEADDPDPADDAEDGSDE